MELFFFWLVFSVIAGAIAGGKGRSGFGFFLLAVILSPLVGIICALIARPNTERTEREALEDGTVRRCPACAELVRVEAVKCRYCQSALEPLPRPLTGADQIARWYARRFKKAEAERF